MRTRHRARRQRKRPAEPEPRANFPAHARSHPCGRHEQARLLARAGDDYLVALDEHGKSLTTVDLSRWLAERLQDGRNLCFVIGGPDGLGPEILKKAALRWSLSGLTFPHAMVRVILAEQLYRAHSVLHNHPYHRE